MMIEFKYENPKIDNLLKIYLFLVRRFRMFYWLIRNLFIKYAKN
jgi:hypothetical protein